MIIGKSARFYQERREQQSRPTRQGPAMKMAPENNLVQQMPLDPPLPLPALLADVNGAPPPDAGPTVPWPHGEIDIQ